MKRLLLLLAGLLILTGVTAQTNPMEPVPMDPDVRYGKLENGMTYYIRHNEKPKGQAEFHVLTAIGAVHESDSQQGLAHFLEHMAFNGLKNMPGKSALNYLEKNGIRFGAEVNAGTWFDMTTYNISNVPTANEGLVDTTMLILHDYLHFIDLQPAEIDKERGVIQEELRTRENAAWRALNARIAAIYGGSKYPTRNVIGHMEGLKSFSYQEIIDFYQTWYRPEHQVMVVVGDVNVDQIEAKLKVLMSDIPASPADAPQKEASVAPDSEEPVVSIFADAEQTYSAVEITFRREAFPLQMNNTGIRMMLDLMDNAMVMMFSNRIDEIAMKPDAPFMGGYMATGNVFDINPSHDLVMAMVQTREGEIPTGYRALATELENIRRNGFTQGEFERTIAEMKSNIETRYANRDDRMNREFANAYLDHFREGTAIPDAQTTRDLQMQFLDMIGVNEVNEWAKNVITLNNQVIFIQTPVKEGLAIPTAEEILNIRNEVLNTELTPYEDSVVKEPLIPAGTKLKGSPVKSTHVNSDLGVTEWTLKNGVKIRVKPTQLKADEVRLSIQGEGGKALLPTDQLAAADVLSGVMSMSGVGKFSATDLRKQLAGVNASTSLSVSTYRHGMEGFSTPKDLEALLQLCYLSFTAPRFSQTDFDTVIGMTKTSLENMQNDPGYIFGQKVGKVLYNDDPRRQPMTVETLETVRFESLPQIYKTLYPGANSFVFTFVGNVDLTTLKPLVEKYIGSIPVTKTALKYTDDNVRFVSGEVTDKFTTKMALPKVSEFLVLTSDANFTIRERQIMELLSQTLTARYVEEVREERGGTYGVGVGGVVLDLPVQQNLLQIQFDTNEELADELVGVVLDEIRKIATEGPRQDDIENARANMAKTFKNSLEQNYGWMEVLNLYYRHNMNLPKDSETTLMSITYEEVQQLAKKLLDSGNKLHVEMRPAAAE